MRHARWTTIRGFFVRRRGKALAAAAILAAASGGVSLMAAAEMADRAVLRADRTVLRTAVDAQRQATLAAVLTQADRDPTSPALPNQDSPRLDHVWTVKNGIWLPRDSSQPPSDQLRLQLLALLEPVSRGVMTSASALVSADGKLYDVAVSGIAATGTRRADAGEQPQDGLAGLREVDGDWLGRLALATDRRGLHLADRRSAVGADEGRLDLGQNGPWQLTWRPDRPSRNILLTGTLMLAIFTAVAAARRFGLSSPLIDTKAPSTVVSVPLTAGSYDWLSGLPNRVYFNHVLDRALMGIKQQHRQLALLYVDIDRFKEINDNYGIEVGDVMIQAVTQRILALLRPCDVMARFEGDAFLILQFDIDGKKDCDILGQKLLGVMRDPFDIDGSSIAASLSIGVAIGPDDASERIDLMQAANLALYRAKREGRSRLSYYQPRAEPGLQHLKSIESQLRAAIDHEGLVLRYQPIVSTQTGKTVCVEALVRWQHPTEGLIAPDFFIGLAEERGLIIPLGQWVLRQACRDAQDWPGVRIAVNVSPIQFRHPDFVGTVRAVLRDTGLDPQRLELELTEGVLVENEEEAFTAISSLRDLGVRMALDDFGTGYSSLIYLRRFAFDKIKIDRAFIEALEPTGESAILVDSVVQLGRALGLTVTAEGVETEEQRDLLRGLHCDQLQGYLISKPIAHREFCQFLKNERSVQVIDKAVA